ncbi:uncharacterized protein AAES06_019332 isoform 2-T2 [Glossophaga mutica]
MSGHPSSDGGGAAPPGLRLQCPPRGPGAARAGRPIPLDSRARPRGRGGQESAPAAAAAAAGRRRGAGRGPGLAGAQLLQEAGPTPRLRRRRRDSVALGPAGSRLRRRAPETPLLPFPGPPPALSPLPAAASSSSSSSSASFRRPHAGPASRGPRRAQPPRGPAAGGRGGGGAAAAVLAGALRRVAVGRSSPTSVWPLAPAAPRCGPSARLGLPARCPPAAARRGRNSTYFYRPLPRGGGPGARRRRQTDCARGRDASAPGFWLRYPPCYLPEPVSSWWLF